MESSEPRPLIAIVDDDLASANLLAIVLATDYDCFIATSGIEAIAMIRSRQPDLVLLDIMLPDISGYETCVALQAEPATSKIPVIFITGLEESENEELGFVAGAVDYQSKPINPGILKVRIARILDNTMYIEFLEVMLSQKDLTLSVFRDSAKAMLNRSVDSVDDIEPD
jgi:putative two-component system response regulator